MQAVPADATSLDALPNPPCSQCGGPHPFDTSVPSVVWNSVIRGRRLPDYMCLTCIVRAFIEVRQSFTAELVGEELPRTPIEVRIDGAIAQDASRVCDENTRLRSTLHVVLEQHDRWHYGTLKEFCETCKTATAALDAACAPQDQGNRGMGAMQSGTGGT